MKIAKVGSAQPQAVALPKTTRSILVGGEIVLSFNSPNGFLWNRAILLSPVVKPKTLGDFKSPDGFVHLSLENFNDVLELVPLDSVHKNFIRNYFNQINSGNLPTTKGLAQWIKSQNNKIKIDDELLVIKFLLDFEGAGISVLPVFDDAVFNKVFKVYSALNDSGLLEEANFKKALECLNIINEKSKLKFANDLFGKVNESGVLCENLHSLSSRFNDFKKFILNLRESALDFLVDYESQISISRQEVEPNVGQSNGLPVNEILPFSSPVDVANKIKLDNCIVDLKCPLLDEIGVDYRHKKFRVDHTIEQYKHMGDHDKKTILHPVVHRFKWAHTIDVLLTFKNGLTKSLSLPTAAFKSILNDINDPKKGYSSYDISQWDHQRKSS